MRKQQPKQEEPFNRNQDTSFGLSLEVKRRRLIFLVTEGHWSPRTASKYRINFNRILDYIKIHDLDVFLDLGKEAIQELVMRYTLSLTMQKRSMPVAL